jgi:predicted PurR-regulated permease PerM
MKHTFYKATNLQERIVNSMILTVCVLALVYCCILLSLVFSVIERKQALAETKDLVSTLSSVESQYSNEITKINDTVLASKNFARVEGTTLTVRKDPIASYTVLYDNR